MATTIWSGWYSRATRVPEAYRHTSEGWRIFHSHWSFVTPELKEANPETI